MAVYGYARVSSEEQDTAIQTAALKAAGCSVVREEKKSGTTRNGRTELETLLAFMREGDVLIITRIDRLARSMKDLQDIVHELKQKGIFLRATEQPIDTSTAAGKAFFDMLGVFSEFETNLRRERQLEGVKKAKAEGKYKGTAPKIDRIQVARLRSEGKNVTQIARAMGISRESVYRIEREMRAA